MPPQPDSVSNASTQFPDSKSRKGSHSSKTSISTSSTAQSHKLYLESLRRPTKEETELISRQQEANEDRIYKRLSMEHAGTKDKERANAATMIQRNYRGYRARRQLQGFGLDASHRWVEAVREAQYRNLTAPKARESFSTTSTNETRELVVANEQKQFAREKWKMVGTIARKAVEDDLDVDSDDDDDDDVPEDQKEERRKIRIEKRKERQKEAKMMDLQYFLEMVDLKHRYGVNLRVYHEEWKRSSTHENFFYWLDEGEGRLVDASGCSRDRLDRERVRYLSREERLDYLVKIDKEGRLCWAKNGAHIDTTTKYKDSIHGIVPVTDTTPAYVSVEAEAVRELHNDSSASSSDSDDDGGASARAGKYAAPELDGAKGLRKVTHVSAATIFNRLLRSSIKKNTWIFVADTSFRLYVGIKQSGTFQHSSFLQGSRITAAGLIKIKDGRLDKLSPLSGHYRPRTSNFRAFIHSLNDAGADMSHVSISRSYVVLAGLEAYVETRQKGKRLLKMLIHGRDKKLSPDQLKKREEEEMDKSEIAESEKRMMNMMQEDKKRDENKADVK